MKDKLFQLFFCIYIFWNTVISTYLGMKGMEMDGSLMRLCLVIISGISLIFYAIYPQRSHEDKQMLGLLVLFGVLYYSTGYFYTSRQYYDGYIGQFLRWGADCVPGCLIGMTLMKQRTYNLIHKILPWECLALTPFMAIATLINGQMEGQMHLEGGMNYQSVAYMLAVLFCFCFFYAFIYGKSGIITKLIMSATMLVQAVCCAMSGGRGGLVLLVVYVVYMLYYLLKNNIISKKNLILVAIFTFVGFMILADRLGLWTSSGFQRSSNSMNDDDRWILWKDYWNYIVDNPVIGYGLGGDYFTVGFYSHNIIVDWLLETGIIGTLILLSIFYKTYKNIFALAKENSIFVVILILFIYGIIMNCFSGYWITMGTTWMCFGVAITASTYRKLHYKKLRS